MILKKGKKYKKGGKGEKEGWKKTVKIQINIQNKITPTLNTALDEKWSKVKCSI